MDRLHGLVGLAVESSAVFPLRLQPISEINGKITSMVPTFLVVMNKISDLLVFLTKHTIASPLPDRLANLDNKFYVKKVILVHDAPMCIIT